MLPVALALGVLGNTIWKGEKRLAEKEADRQREKDNEQQVKDAARDVAPVLKEAGDGMGPSAYVIPKTGVNFDNAQAFGTEGQSAAAAGIMNTQAAKLNRVASVLDSQGKVSDAVKHRDAAHKMVDEGTIDLIDDLNTLAPSLDQVRASKAPISISPSDAAKANFNLHGKIKLDHQTKFEAYEGKDWQGQPIVDIRAVGPNGQPVVQSAYEMKMALSMAAADREKERLKQGDTAHDNSIADGTLAVHQRNAATAEKNAATQEQWRKDQIRLGGMKVAAAGVGGAPAPTVSLKDVRDFEDDANKRITEIFQPKEGADANERAALGSQRNQLVAKASTLFQQNALRGGIFTPGLILQAMDLERDPKNVQATKWSDGNVYRTVNVNGTLVMVSGALAQKAEPQQPISPPPAEAPQQQRAASAGISQAESLRKDPVWGRHVAALDQLAAGVVTAKTQLAAAAKSGDAKAIQAYAANLQTARDQLKAQAARRLGNNATQYLNSISGL